MEAGPKTVVPVDVTATGSGKLAQPHVRLTGKCDRYVLSNGVEIPCLGFGTYMVPNDERGEHAIRCALETGFRHIDTAAQYGNEDLLGRVIAESGIPRGELFLTSKLRNVDQGYESALKAFEKTCRDLGTDYLDLYLIHWPKVGGFEDAWRERVWDSWRAFEELYAAGRVRAIGVSNFLVHHLEVLLERASVVPHVNQIELNPTYQQRETVTWCRERGIQLEAWAPLGRGKVARDQHVVEMAERLGKDVGQICVRWALQHGFVTMPKSMREERIRSNSEVFDFELSDEDMTALDALNTTDNYTFHPDRLEEWAVRVAAAHAESGV